MKIGKLSIHFARRFIGEDGYGLYLEISWRTKYN